MYRNIILLFTVFGAILFLMPRVEAEQLSQGCARVENTADIMGCVKKRHDKATKRLNTVFEALVGEVGKENSEEQKSALRQTQKEWLLYRDRACDWEIGQEQAESLKRIRSLLCQSILAEQRADILSMSLTKPVEEDKEDGLEGFEEHYSATPRWMNALAVDHSKVFWRYHDYVQADLDCDGEEELIMPGVRMEDRPVRTEGMERYLTKAVVSITENPVTGRPESRLFDFSVSETVEEKAAEVSALCSVDLKLSVVAGDEAQETSEAGVFCGNRLKIDSAGCASRYLVWDGKSYLRKVE